MSFAALKTEILKIPPMTRFALGSAVLVVAPLMAKFWYPGNFLFDWRRIFYHFEIYRLYTSLWIPWRLDDPIRYLFDIIMLYRHLLPMEVKSYNRRLPDMAWQFFWSVVAIMAMCYPLGLPLFWTSLLGFVVYLSSRLAPNEIVSVFGLFQISVQWFPYVLVALDTFTSPLIGCGTVAGLIVAQVLFMLEYDSPATAAAEPTLKRNGWLRAPGWLIRLLGEPNVQTRNAIVKTEYGQATAPAGRGLRDQGRGANDATGNTPGYQWGRGNRLGGQW